MFRKFSKLRRWFRDERGSFAIYAGLTLPAMLALMGFGLDYWSTLSVKARLDAAADTAVLAGVGAAINYIHTNSATMDSTTLHTNAVAAGKKAAIAAFAANSGAAAGAAVTPNPPDIQYDPVKLTVTGTVSYSTQRSLGFAGLMGFTSMTLAGSAGASQRQATYINVYVVVDTSQSMGIAANQTEMDKLYKASAPYNADGQGIGCVFGCHELQGTSITMEDIAHAAGVTLRIDVATDAIISMAQTAKTFATNSNIGFAIYSMQANPNDGTYLKAVYPSSGVTTDYDALVTSLQPQTKTLPADPTNNSIFKMLGISVASPTRTVTTRLLDLGSNNGSGAGDSGQSTSLSKLADALPQNGDGSSASSPMNFVFVVTDGTTDLCGSSHCMGTVVPSDCDPLKRKATVGAIYTTYVPIYTHNDPNLGLDGRYTWLIQPIVGLIPGNLQGCASSASWYYEASDDVGLKTAMQKLFAATLTTLQLTQ